MNHLTQAVDEDATRLGELCDQLEKAVEQSKLDSELLMQSVLQEAFQA